MLMVMLHHSGGGANNDPVLNQTKHSHNTWYILKWEQIFVFLYIPISTTWSFLSLIHALCAQACRPESELGGDRPRRSGKSKTSELSQMTVHLNRWRWFSVWEDHPEWSFSRSSSTCWWPGRRSVHSNSSTRSSDRSGRIETVDALQVFADSILLPNEPRTQILPGCPGGC